MPDLAWYVQRLGRMSPAEVAWRVEDRLRQVAWSHRRFGPPTLPGGPARPGGGWVADGRAPRRVVAVPTAPDLSTLPEEARRDLLAAADALLDGRWEVLGVVRADLTDPDWAVDPISGQAYPSDRCTFRIDYRSPGDPRNVKQVWELSRHHHLTVLAAAWRLTGDDRYATRAADHLRSWWRANPVLAGVNWCSGIELGIRLISWVWTRRLLDGWSGAPALFEENELAVHQVYWHQRWLAAFRSRGSSANNHVVAEAAGQVVASCGFPWFAESNRWRVEAATLLEDELAANTFDSGFNREQAFEYHGLVAELGLVAACEAEACGTRLRPSTWRLLCRMLDALAAVVDCEGHPPRYGDGDDGRALVVDDPAADRWRSLLATGAALFGAPPWWPPTVPDAQSLLLAGLLGHRVDGGARPAGPVLHAADAGVTVLRTPPGEGEELWCRCDGGPHGFLSIAAHGHADALSVEVRAGGVELLVDPGTYCYHGEPAWRRYFRSTLGHNTLEFDGQDQSVAGGPFLWASHAATRVDDVDVAGPGLLRWSAEHDGYERLDPPVRHRRTVILDPDTRTLEITDRVAVGGGTTRTGDHAARTGNHAARTGGHAARLAFHLGPGVTAVVDGSCASLTWDRPHGGQGSATLELPAQLAWEAYRGSTDPILGWYSRGFGRREPSTTLVGSGQLGDAVLCTRLRLAP